LFYAEVPSSSYYDFIKPDKEKLDYKKSKGRPVPGYTKNPSGTISFDSSIVNILKSYRKQLNFQNAGGCKILHEYLERDYGITVNHKKIYRLCKENSLLLPRNKKKVKINRKICENRKINKPNQLWQFDIKTDYIHGENSYFYLLAFIDVFNRKIVNYHIGKSCKAQDLKSTLAEALLLEGITDINLLVTRSDNGPQMTSHMFNNYVNEIGLEHEFIPVKTPNKNAYIESFFSIYETEFLQVRYFDSFSDVFQQTVQFMENYNTKRLHGSIKKLPPIEFTEKFNLGLFEDIEISV
jgi:putative transposase